MEQKVCKVCDEPVEEKLPPCPLQCGSPKCKSYQVKLIVTNKPIVWMLGGPGSGKGTQCARIVQKYNFVHISTGELLREEVAKQTSCGVEVENIIKSGKLVPDSIVLNLMSQAIIAAGHKINGYLIDGYPRDKTQGYEFCNVIRPPDAIIFLETSPSAMKVRLLQRATKESRSDDNENTINARLKTFYACCDQVLSIHPRLVHRIPGDGRPEEIFDRIDSVLTPLVCCHRANRTKYHEPH